MNAKTPLLFMAAIIAFFSCNEKKEADKASARQPVYRDVPYLQDYAVKYKAAPGIKLMKIHADRNDVIQILTDEGLYRPDNGHFQYPGTLEKDETYIPMAGRHLAGMIVYKDQFVYLDDTAVFSNAWAGKLYCRHGMPGAKMLAGGDDFTFMVSDGKSLSLVKNPEILWQKNLEGEQVTALEYSWEFAIFIVHISGCTQVIKHFQIESKYSYRSFTIRNCHNNRVFYLQSKL